VVLSQNRTSVLFRMMGGIVVHQAASIFINHAVNPARLVTAQAFSLVASGNVASGAATAMLQLLPGSFAFETRRPAVYVARFFASSHEMLLQQLTTR
jgi:hypothetical protein